MTLVVMTLLSAIGFVVDRFVFSEPATAVAAVPTPTRPRPARKTEATSAAKATEESNAPDPSLVFLDKLQNKGGGRDVFSMSQDMLLYYKTMQQTQPNQQGPRPGSPEEFALNHRLEGTYAGKNGSLSVINGEVLRPDDEIDGFRLTRIGPFGVELRRGRDRVALSLPKPGIIGPAKTTSKKTSPASPASPF